MRIEKSYLIGITLAGVIVRVGSVPPGSSGLKVAFVKDNTIAVSPPLDAADFHGRQFNQAGRVRTTQQISGLLAESRKDFAASTRRAWISNIAAFPKQRSLSVRRTSVPTDVYQVQKLIEMTNTRKEAIEILEDAMNWAPTASRLTEFMRKHKLRARWQHFYQRPQADEVRAIVERATTIHAALRLLGSELAWWPRPDALISYIDRHGLRPGWETRRRTRPPSLITIQAILLETRRSAEALTRLKNEHGWIIGNTGLNAFMKRHRLSAGWVQKDPRRVYNIIAATYSLKDATAALKRELYWETSPKNLRRYMARHGLLTPDQWRKTSYNQAA